MFDLWTEQLSRVGDAELAEHFEKFNKMVYDLGDREDPALKSVVKAGLQTFS